VIPALKIEMFAKTLGMGYPNAYLGRLCPSPKASWINTGLRRVATAITGLPRNRRGQMRKDRNKIKSAVHTRRKTDSAKWKDRAFKSLTYAQIRIRHLCDAFRDGHITKEEFKRELPLILSARDREKRDMNS